MIVESLLDGFEGIAANSGQLHVEHLGGEATANRTNFHALSSLRQLARLANNDPRDVSGATATHAISDRQTWLSVLVT